MPSPHPSIMYGPEHEADGLKWPIEDRSPRDKFIWPLYIESALSSVKYGVEGIVTLSTEEVIEKVAGGLPKLSADQEALRDRLATRLKLSKQYMRKWRRVQAKVGVIALQDKMEKMTERQCAIEERLFTAKPVTRADMTRKLALYDYYKDHIPENGASIIRDLRRLFQTQTTLAA